ncbi:4-hydroxy-tetrahydrodipicolinate synthase [Chlamydiifrater volucris]|uniref:4-hydroxy-tetrahydrodipicolinate synthase n=1 Tax=Chlamydiifrater volucris TaxID=2681470 RepID=UPI001BCCF7BB|nr:4-hydroxy-tetrahydrodipicolinate synthase [Chlamydiifrater volucris]
MHSTLLPEVIVACVTPFLDTGEVDFGSLIRVLRCAEKVSGGILLFGSTGEGMALSLSEKLQIVQYACDQYLSVPILLGVPGIDSSGAKKLMRACDSFPIQGYLLTTPIYSKPGVHGQIDWFRNLMRSTMLPIILYNIPGRCGSPLYSEVVRSLSTESNFYGVKDASGSPSSCKEFSSICSKCKVFCGDDVLLQDFLNHGASGWINVSGNVWPEVASKYYGFLKQRIDRKELMEDRPWRDACSLLSSGGNPVSVKVVLERLGVIKSATVREPLSVLDFPPHNDIEFIHNELMSWSRSLEVCA